MVNLSTRGFGRSCGVPGVAHGGLRARVDAHRRPALRGARRPAPARPAGRPGRSRGRTCSASPGCPAAPASSVSLAFLRDRVRLPDGTLVPWRSPAGTPLRIGAAFGRWAWDDLASAIAQNGRLRDDRPGADPLAARRLQAPLGRAALHRRRCGRLPRPARGRLAGRPHRLARPHAGGPAGRREPADRAADEQVHRRRRGHSRRQAGPDHPGQRLHRRAVPRRRGLARGRPGPARRRAERRVCWATSATAGPATWPACSASTPTPARRSWAGTWSGPGTARSPRA